MTFTGTTWRSKRKPSDGDCTMANLSGFSRNIIRRANNIEKNTTRVKKDVARRVLTQVVTRTPILSGRARYHWNVSFNAPDHSYDYDSFSDGSRTGAWLGKMATSSVAILRATQKDDIYISNGLPYIGKLNRGYSPQASARYVQVAALVGAQTVRSARILR